MNCFCYAGRKEFVSVSNLESSKYFFSSSGIVNMNCKRNFCDRQHFDSWNNSRGYALLNMFFWNHRRKTYLGEKMNKSIFISLFFSFISPTSYPLFHLTNIYWSLIPGPTYIWIHSTTISSFNRHSLGVNHMQGRMETDVGCKVCSAWLAPGIRWVN